MHSNNKIFLYFLDPCKNIDIIRGKLIQQYSKIKELEIFSTTKRFRNIQQLFHNRKEYIDWNIYSIDYTKKEVYCYKDIAITKTQQKVIYRYEHLTIIQQKGVFW